MNLNIIRMGHLGRPTSDKLFVQIKILKKINSTQKYNYFSIFSYIYSIFQTIMLKKID